jgi:hypothetical protein
MTRDPPLALERRQGSAFGVGRCVSRSVVISGSLICTVALSPGAARAIEPLALTEPDVLREPAQVTRVVDAWDERGGIDLHFTLGYSHNWKRGTISRETQNVDVAAGAASGTVRVPVADVSENTSRLNVRAELGLYHDLALILRVPVVLSQSLTLESRGASVAALEGAPGVPLFGVPFRSPNRSGVEFLGVGVDWGILNQGRDGALPSLLVGVEGRFTVSEAMHACGPDPSADEAASNLRCRYPADINRNGVGGEFLVPVSGGTQSLEGELPGSARRAGVSRGTTGVDVHAAISRRFAYLEPYLLLGMLFELPTDGSDFDGSGPFRRAPPWQARLGLGTELVPWELVEQFQRLSIDVRAVGTYRSRGRDYSELFDALGSSSASSYRRPNFAGYVSNPDIDGQARIPSVVDVGSQRVFPTGLTEIEAHGSYALRLTARWQAGQYVHFDAGGGLALIDGHFITLGQPCDPTRAVAPANAGPCAVGGESETTVLGAPDPGYRPETDQPGRRFLLESAHSIDAWVGATVMF